MTEIEHKFLVQNEAYKEHASSFETMKQGFLNTHPQRTVRVRLWGDRGYLTIKGISNEAGTSRFEWEKEISTGEAASLLKLCEPGMIEKTRYTIPVGDHIFEVDEFHGANEGLVIAEVELTAEGESFIRPEWLGKEVTGIKRYYNSMLSNYPYTEWKAEERKNDDGL